MSFQAIIFDLFFTLIDPLGGASGEETEYTVLGMDRADFEARNRMDYEVRGCGKIRDPYRMMAHILRGLDIPKDLVRRAADARLERIKRALYGADPKNIALLNRLREAGYKTALISNADIADIYYWADSPLSACFDETVFSYDAELLKPDPRIYRLALERLQVKPEHCLFVGDGGHQELRGAREAGMITVLTTEYLPRTEKIERLKIDADYTVEKLEAIAEIEEIKQTLRDYRNNKESCAVREKTETILKRTPLDTLLLKTLEKIQHFDFIDLAAPLETLHLSARSFNALSRAGITTVGMMLDTDKEMLQEIKQLGVKSIGEILDRQEKIKEFALTKEGNGIAAKQERIQRLTDAFRRIPTSRLNKSPRAYLSSYCGVDIKAILSDFEPFLSPLRTIAEIPSTFEKVSLTRKSTNDFISILNVISLDLRAMVQKLLAGIYNNPKNGRLLSILQQRYNGLTLQQIADKSGLTRERIRQLKTKGFDMLVKHLHTINIDMLIFINADYNGDYLLTTREICRYFDDLEHIDILLYVAKMQGLSNIFKYHKHFDIFFHADMIQNIDNIVEAVKNLPYIIEIENRDTLLSELCISENLPMKAVAIEFDYVYKLACKVYHKRNLITTQMYEYVLEHYYPKGIRLYDDETIRNFRKRVIETFGDIELPKNDRAIDARLADIAILCDRGAYIHPHHIGIDKTLIEEICTYVNDIENNFFV